MRLRIYPDVHENGIWCIDEGTNATEKRFTGIKMVKCSAQGRSNLAADNEKEPKYWLETEGTLIERNGVAVIV